MVKAGPQGAKLLKIVHLIFITLWVGGLFSWIPLAFGASFSDYSTTYATYVNMREIAWNVIGWGGIGSFFTGLMNALFTNAGLFKQRWVSVKFFTVIGQILFGMFFIEHKLLTNISLLEQEKTAALTDETFLHNHFLIETGMLFQLTIFFALIAISVLKPRLRKTT